ncbi:hypothetical protein [Liquorilactobacillus nagelii]|jgi:hypothetical protein|uniref:hypothetical protein n=1 Tax=Liquorilactobacillus nagelii TaxID=82688 RepID=UPI00242D0DD4|nr:hypothetical protein [Liquorilactobacillus nagelii]MCI1700027.1 hypothetical protein [Liquorilactobacillus nagelii]
MHKSVNLKYEYFNQAPSGGGTSTLNLKTGYSNDVNFTSYIIKKTDDEVEFFSLYETGLAIWAHNTSSKVEIKSNKEFRLEDDGTFWLVSD